MLCEDNEGSDKVLVIRKKTIPLGVFEAEAMRNIHKLRKHFEKIPSKGLKEEDCQRLCLLNRLNDLQRAVYGLTQDDLLNCEIESIEDRGY